jgi:hypothetical protein
MLFFNKKILLTLIIQTFFSTFTMAGNSISDCGKQPKKKPRSLKTIEISQEFTHDHLIQYFTLCLNNARYGKSINNDLLTIVLHVEESENPIESARLALAYVLLQYAQLDSLTIDTYEALRRIYTALAKNDTSHPIIKEALEAHPHLEIKSFDTID